MSIEKAELMEQSVRADLDYQQIRLDSPCTSPQDFSALRRTCEHLRDLFFKGCPLQSSQTGGVPLTAQIYINKLLLKIHVHDNRCHNKERWNHSINFIAVADNNTTCCHRFKNCRVATVL